MLLVFLFVAGLLALWWVLARPMIGQRVLPRMPDKVDPSTLRERVEILSQRFVPRDSDHPEILIEASEYISSEFRYTGARVATRSLKSLTSATET